MLKARKGLVEMKYGKIDLGQIEALINKIGGEDGMRGLLAGELRVVPVNESAKAAKKQGVLVRDGSVSAVTLSQGFNPQKFYQTQGALYVWDNFKTRIIAAASFVKAGTGFKKTTSWKLTQIASGLDLLAERPKDVWLATDFCAWLSVKLAQQPNGKAGELLNTGHGNLFLVEGVDRSVFVVDVGWSSLDRGWGVSAWGIGDDWNAGRRFVSKPIAL